MNRKIQCESVCIFSLCGLAHAAVTRKMILIPTAATRPSVSGRGQMHELDRQLYKRTRRKFYQPCKVDRVLDVFDIILVAVLIYYAFNFLRNRRAGKLVFGVVILFALQLLSDLLGLVATQFILQNVLQLGLIALLILFQPELRSALEKMGGSGALRSFIGITGEREDKATAAIAAVASAAADMSRNKTGALMVFERSTKLGDIASTGVIIDASPSTFLIRNIFFRACTAP